MTNENEEDREYTGEQARAVAVLLEAIGLDTLLTILADGAFACAEANSLDDMRQAGDLLVEARDKINDVASALNVNGEIVEATGALADEADSDEEGEQE